jgi:L,D-transpeptidase YcbB
MKSPKISIARLQLLMICTIILVISACQNSDSPKEIVPDFFKKNVINLTGVNQQIGAWTSNQNINIQAFDNTLDSAAALQFEQNIKILYRNYGNKCIWVSEKGVTKDANLLLLSINTLSDEGIDLKVYRLEKLKNWIAEIASGKASEKTIADFELAMSYAYTRSISDMKFGDIGKLEKEYYNKNDTGFNVGVYCANNLSNNNLKNSYSTLIPDLKLYKLLKTELLALNKIKQNGGWPIIVGLKDSSSANKLDSSITALRKRLFIEIGVPKDTVTAAYNEELALALKAFQHKHDMRITGIVDTATLRRLNYTADTKIAWVKNNMERIRKLNQSFPQPYVWVNIPSMQLQYINNDSVQYKMRTVVGRTSRATPTLDAPMTNIVINPNWSVPPTIMKEEIIPGIARKGGSYLTRRGLTAYLGGRKVNPELINEKNFKRYRIEQKPGLNSSLGAVKFNLPNVHSIYLHDTPHREDFVKYYRAYSSGCIRVEKPRDFAVFLLADTNYTKEKVDKLISEKETHMVNLKKPLDVRIVYLTNDADSMGNLLYLRDIYGMDKLR